MTYIKTKWSTSLNQPVRADLLNKIEAELEVISNAAYTGGVGLKGDKGDRGAPGGKGFPGANGSDGSDGLDGDSAVIDWSHYIGNSKYQNTTTVIATGDVLEYTYEPTTTTVYRHITTAVTGLYPTEDAFYSGFNGVSLSNLIVGR